MPTYEYLARDEATACDHCRQPFDVIQHIADKPIEACPHCGAPVTKQISACAVGRSKSSLDHRAKAAGFTKLKRLGKGEYEKQY